MSRKRKRSSGQSSRNDGSSNKRLRVDEIRAGPDSVVKTRLLSFYYPNVQTLLEYLLHRLANVESFTRRIEKLPADDHVMTLLKTSLVGSFKHQAPRDRVIRTRDFEDFTQQLVGLPNGTRRTSGGVSSSLGDGSATLSDLVDFAIWQTCTRTHRHLQRPPHILCNGYVRTDAPRSTADEIAALGGIHELSVHRPNAQVDRIKGEDWAALLHLMGKEGEYVMLELILDCGIFVSIPAGRDNYLQLSGISVGELPVLDAATGAEKARMENSGVRPRSLKVASPRLPSQIAFVRSRMFYARAALNGKGEVHFGLRHIHVLNRFPNSDEESHTMHVMKYIFPRQFGLHNAFTSQVDKRETSHPFKDYTLREQEIVRMMQRQGKQSMPKRLRGECFRLIRKLQILHRRCAYKELLKHYCPFPEMDGNAKSRKRKGNAKNMGTQSMKIGQSPSKSCDDESKNLVDLATPASSVSAFVRAVIGNLLPKKLLGEGRTGETNWIHLHYSIDRFVKGKRFENISLDSVLQGIKIASVDWLRPPGVSPSDKLAKTDFLKRSELVQELLYYAFDSLVIPLIRSNFHVTESNEHRYRLFYFRHDVWKKATEPAISQLRSKMYQELTQDKAREILGRSPLGFSQVRLLPKKSTARPITNLKRRPVVKRNGRTWLGASINSTLKNVFSMLNYEKLKQPELLGSAMFSVDDIYPRLQAFKKVLLNDNLANAPLYFVKVDVKSCFDTIPQQALLELVEKICQRQSFTVKHHTQVKAVSESRRGCLGASGNRKPTKKFQAIAHAESSSQGANFPELVNTQYACGKKAQVFAEGSMQSRVEAEALLDLLDDHISRNIVRIGKKYYRQKNGIAQGSVVSTLLCSFFYGDFELTKLGFLQNQSNGARSMLVRLVDDFLLMTTSQSYAEKFLSTMLEGDPEYGISVKAEKTLTNFVPSCETGCDVSPEHSRFPWCGTFIDTRTLALSRDRSKASGIDASSLSTSGSTSRLRRKKRLDLADSTTAEAIRRPGAAFYRKTLAAVRLNVRDMYTDTNAASAEDVKQELLIGMTEVAEKSARYLARLRSLGPQGKQQRITDVVLKKTIEDAAKLMTVLTKEKVRTQERARKYRCSLRRRDMRITVIKAFSSVLQKQQTRYRDILAWLRCWYESIEKK